jgi:hypothetical protein
VALGRLCDFANGQTFSLGTMCGPGETLFDPDPNPLPPNLVSLSTCFWKTLCTRVQLFKCYQSVKGTLSPLCRRHFNKCLRHFVPSEKSKSKMPMYDPTSIRQNVKMPFCKYFKKYRSSVIPLGFVGDSTVSEHIYLHQV